MRWTPLALFALFHALVWLRLALHRRRTGRSGNFLRAGRTPFARLRALGFQLLVITTWIQCLRAAAGRIEIAPEAWLRALGLVLGAGGTLLMFVAQLQLGESWRIGIEEAARPGLVARGMYRWSRNPIFLWMIVSWIGLALLLFDPVVGSVALLLALGVRTQVREEERWLCESYGAGYREYAARVGRFLPGIGRLRDPG